MIEPDKFTDINWSILNVSGNVIKILNEMDSLSFDLLFERICEKLSERFRDEIECVRAVEYLLFGSIHFLYLLGFLDYCSEAKLIVRLKKEGSNDGL